jgi:hypothetical protein
MSKPSEVAQSNIESHQIGYDSENRQCLCRACQVSRAYLLLLSVAAPVVNEWRGTIKVSPELHNLRLGDLERVVEERDE